MVADFLTKLLQGNLLSKLRSTLLGEIYMTTIREDMSVSMSKEHAEDCLWEGVTYNDLAVLNSNASHLGIVY